MQVLEISTYGFLNIVIDVDKENKKFDCCWLYFGSNNFDWHKYECEF